MSPPPSRDILAAYQRSGVSWQAVDREAVREAIDIAIAAGVVFTERLAIMDLHYWIDRQSVRPYRYYAPRWKWGPKRVYNLFRRVGVFGAREHEGAGREHEGASGEQDEAKNARNQRAKEQKGAEREHKGASGEQYTSSSSLSPSGEEKKNPSDDAGADAPKRRRRPREKVQPPLTDDDRRLADALYRRIRDNDPGAKPPNLDTWAEEIGRLHRLDGRSYEEIEAIIEWCQRDPFWRSNILSASKLRKQFPTLRMQQQRGRNGSTAAHTGASVNLGGPSQERKSTWEDLADEVDRELDRKRRQRVEADVPSPSSGS